MKDQFKTIEITQKEPNLMQIFINTKFNYMPIKCELILQFDIIIAEKWTTNMLTKFRTVNLIEIIGNKPEAN